MRRHIVWLATSLALVVTPAVTQAAVVRGTLRETVLDYRNGSETTLYRVVSDGESTPVEPVGELSAVPGNTVQVRGTWREGVLEGRVMTVVEPAATPTRAQEGIRTLAVILTYFADKPAEM